MSKQPLLDVRFYPRMSLYLDKDEKGSFIVDATISYSAGQPYSNSTFEQGRNGSVPFTTMNITIMHSGTGKTLVPWSEVSINSTGTEFSFDLSSFTNNGTTFPDHPVPVNLIGVSPDAIQSYYSVSTITILPSRKDVGSVARIDRLYGGLQVHSSLTNQQWKPIFPYSFYTNWDWIASTINNSSATYNLSSFRSSGYNLIHPVPPGGSDPFNRTIFEEFLKICDSLELYVMYDMRHTYKNNTSITNQLSLLQNHPSLLLYYTADEPDGWCDPLSATKTSYDHIRSLDPYHPVSLCLNCANFYFDEYSRGADILLEDTYPIAVNTSFSTVYHTPCNTTYGDCGCDNCHAGDPAYPSYVKNRFLDISTRVDDLQTYQEWLRFDAKKPIWGVPQSFFDRGSFWQRFPTAEEEAVMGVLRLNHGVKGIVAWIFPTEESLKEITSSLATVLASDEVVRFTLGAPRMGLQVRGGNGLVDATGWIADGCVLVSIVYLGYEDLDGEVEVSLPQDRKPAAVEKAFLGTGGWTSGEKGLKKDGLKSLEISILKIALQES